MATLNDIAAKLGISKSTVSKALNNATDVSDEMRKRILETAGSWATPTSVSSGKKKSSVS